MAYKLVKIIYDKPVTGDLLKEMLEQENFTVPAKVPMVAVIKPVRPTSIQGSTPEAVTDWNRYTIDLKAYGVAYKAALLAYSKQFTDFALRLSQEFVIVDSVTYIPTSGYTYSQAANRLMGRYGAAVANPIDFICFKNF